ncbi:hypothetical protein BDZ45DRAFT_773209, partial [Acephala macrosclerotiorum]
ILRHHRLHYSCVDVRTRFASSPGHCVRPKTLEYASKVCPKSSNGRGPLHLAKYPFLLFKWAVLRNAPVLSIFVLAIWGLQVVANFPPGALTVVLQPQITNSTATAIALKTAAGGVSTDETMNTAVAIMDPMQYGNDFSIIGLEHNLLRPLAAMPISGHMATETTFFTCRPGQVTYKVNVTYINGAQGFNVSIDPTTIRQLTDVTQNITFEACAIGCTCCGKPGCNCLVPADWSTKNPIAWTNANLKWLSDINNMAIIESMTLALEGQYNVAIQDPRSTYINYTDISGKVLNISQIITIDETSGGDDIYGAIAVEDITGPRNGTIIGSTKLNTLYNAYNNTVGPNIVINQDNLNEMLQNVTLSLMNNFGLWTTNVTATQSTLQNFYSFPQKLNLLLPYYISLLVALPLLVTGAWVLRDNGVSATDGGFLQILTTTSASVRLRRVAVAGSSGGEENVPKSLKELEVMYGLLDDENGRRCVGFGLADEVVRVERGARSMNIEMVRLPDAGRESGEGSEASASGNEASGRS